MIIIDTMIFLCGPGGERAEIFATVESIGSNEFHKAGHNGFKAALMFEVWTEEYCGQKALEYDGKRLTIYRTYSRPDERTELYTEERIGKR